MILQKIATKGSFVHCTVPGAYAGGGEQIGENWQNKTFFSPNFEPIYSLEGGGKYPPPPIKTYIYVYIYKNPLDS